MLYRISVAERGLTSIANIFRSRLSGLDDLLRAGTVTLNDVLVLTDRWAYLLVETMGIGQDPKMIWFWNAFGQEMILNIL